MQVAKVAEEGAYRCHGCSKNFQQSGPLDQTVLDGDHDDGTAQSDVIFRTEYRCHDGWPERWQPCNITEDDWSPYAFLWECGKCERLFAPHDLSSAQSCCR